MSTDTLQTPFVVVDEEEKEIPSLQLSFHLSGSGVEEVCLQTFASNEQNHSSTNNKKEEEEDFHNLSSQEDSSDQEISQNQNQSSYFNHLCISLKSFFMNRFYTYCLPSISELPEFSSSDIFMINGRRYSKSSNEKDETSNEVPFPKFLEDFHSIVWFSYRKDFAPISPTTYSSDVGWGCMLRSGQMILAQALLNHLLGRDFKVGAKNPKEYYQVLSWFLDSPESPYSVHKIAQIGAKYGKNIGEWFGPSTITQTLSELLASHSPGNLVMYTSNDSMLYQDEITKLCTNHATTSTTSSSNSHSHTFKSVLIVIPLRLGVDSVNPLYIPALQQVFTFPQCVGIVGGKPRAAMYFVACQDDYLFYLDPHQVQPTLQLEEGQQDSFAAESFHASVPQKMQMSGIDPSLAIGFYCADQADFNDFISRAKLISKEEHALWGVEEEAPDYRQTGKEDLSVEEFEDDIVIL